MNNLFEKIKKDRQMRQNLKKPYFYVPLDHLRQKVQAHQKKMREPCKPWLVMDYDHSLTKSYEVSQKKMKVARKGVAQLEQQSQSVPPLVVDNQYGSNLDLLNLDEHVSLDQLEESFKGSGLSYAQIFCGVDIPSAIEVETWKIYAFGKSLYNPTKLTELGMQMYLVNKWYLQACVKAQVWFWIIDETQSTNLCAMCV